MKKFFLFLFLTLLPAVCSASFVQVCPDAAGCAESEMVWLQIDPFGSTLDLAVTGTVIGGGLLLWGTGCGVGMFLNTIRKFR
ncbi:MAG: hypothetical protein PHS86_06355 [Syntrophaceae bacterium]|nr:hypothetical protein [Syntrophaceae bacterium]